MFLSRLCGGEDQIHDSAPHTYFLSRLCGGEVKCWIFTKPENFLSRLCGGEAAAWHCHPAPLFLSRLCGGEEEFYPKKSSYSKAYQVKIPFLPYIFCLDITD